MSKSEKIFDQTFTARNFNTSPLTVSELAGDIYDYEIVTVFTNFGTSSNELQLRFNSDSTTNYRAYQMRGYGSSADIGINSETYTYAFVGSLKSTIESLSKIKITGSSADERYIEALFSGENVANKEIAKSSCYWKNTADEITSLTIAYSSNTTSDAHIIIYRTQKVASQSSWELIDTRTWSAETTQKSFTGLSGDADKTYRLTFDGSTGNSFAFRLNADGGANYQHQYLRKSAGTIQAGATNGTFVYTLSSANNYDYIINAETGTKRLITGTTGDETAGYDQVEIGCWYSNTATEITSIDCNSQSSTLTGTAKLYRAKNPNTTADTLPFQTVETVNVSGDFSAGYTFSGLSGDDYKLIKVEWLGDLASAGTMYCQINGDTGSNYSYQRLSASTSTAAAVSAASQTYLEMVAPYNSNPGYAVWYIYPKSGENRPILNIRGEQGNTLMYNAQWWLNSGSELTSLKFYGNNTASYSGTLKLSILR